MVYLRNLDELEELDLGYSGITDAGLASIEGLPKLRSLDLFGTKVTDAGLWHLRHTTKMQCLVLSPLNTDAALECLAKTTSLRTLNLNRTKVTDKGLVHLYGLGNLREVLLYDTRVSDEGTESFNRRCRTARWKSSGSRSVATVRPFNCPMPQRLTKKCPTNALILTPCWPACRPRRHGSEGGSSRSSSARRPAWARPTPCWKPPERWPRKAWTWWSATSSRTAGRRPRRWCSGWTCCRGWKSLTAA